MDESYKIEQSSELISKHFGIEREEFIPKKSEPYCYEFLLKKLTFVISYLLEKDFQRLLNSMYRIDLEESKVAHILETTPSDNIATEISKLIIERELQKVETRIKYRDL